MKEQSPVIYNDTLKVHAPADDNTVIKPQHIKLSEDKKNLLKNSEAGLSLTPQDVVSAEPENKLREGTDGLVYAEATKAAELVSARDDNQIELGADDKLYVAPPTGQDVLSKEAGNLLRYGNDKGVYLSGQDVLSNDGQNHLTVSDVDKKVTFIPDYKEWLSGDRNNALSTSDDGRIFLDKKDLCHCEMHIPETVTVVSQDPGNVLETGADGGAYLGGDDVCQVVNKQIDSGCIDLVSDVEGNILRKGPDNRVALSCAALQDSITTGCVELVSQLRENVLTADKDGRVLLNCKAVDDLVTSGCLDVVSKDADNLVKEGTDKRAFLDKDTVNATVEKGITDDAVHVVSEDAENLVEEGSDKRAYLTKETVNSTVEQGITDGDVTVVSKTVNNIIREGEDGRAFLEENDVCVAVNNSLANECVDLVSPHEGNLITKDASGKVYLNCDAIQQCLPEQEDCNELPSDMEIIDFNKEYSETIREDTTLDMFAYPCKVRFEVTGAESGGAGAGRIVKDDGSVVLWIGASAASRYTNTYSFNVEKGDYIDVVVGQGGAGGAAVTDASKIAECTGQRGTDTVINVHHILSDIETRTVKATSPGGEYAVEDGHGARGSYYAKAGFPMWFPSEDAANSIATNFTTATVGLSGTGGGTIVNKVPKAGVKGDRADVRMYYTVPDKVIPFYVADQSAKAYFFNGLRKLIVVGEFYSDRCAGRSLCYKFDKRNSDNLTKTKPSYIGKTVAIFDIPEDVVLASNGLYSQFVLIPSGIDLSSYSPVSTDTTIVTWNPDNVVSPTRLPSKDGDFSVVFAVGEYDNCSGSEVTGTRRLRTCGFTVDLLSGDGYIDVSSHDYKVLVGVDGIDFDKYDIAVSRVYTTDKDTGDDVNGCGDGAIYIGGGMFAMTVSNDEECDSSYGGPTIYDQATLTVRFARRLKGSCTWEFTQMSADYDYCRK